LFIDPTYPSPSDQLPSFAHRYLTGPVYAEHEGMLDISQNNQRQAPCCIGRLARRLRRPLFVARFCVALLLGAMGVAEAQSAFCQQQECIRKNKSHEALPCHNATTQIKTDGRGRGRGSAFAPRTSAGLAPSSRGPSCRNCMHISLSRAEGFSRNTGWGVVVHQGGAKSVGMGEDQLYRMLDCKCFGHP